MSPRLRHDAVLYATPQELVATVVPFVRGGLAAAEPVLVAVPDSHIALVRTALGDDADRVDFADMADMGRNPARIIPAVQSWIAEHDGRACRLVGEPIWFGRSPAEIAEATRHEELVNLAFADVPAAILCPYDRARLDAPTLAAVPCSHHATRTGEVRTACDRFAAPTAMYDLAAWPLPDPPPAARGVAITDDLAALRRFVRDHVGDRLAPLRLDDLLIATNELATNALRYGRPPARLQVWHDADEVLCQVEDTGRLDDPLVGRIPPPVDQHGGRGLWLVHQLCDLSQLRTGPSGTVVRLHMAR